MNDYPHTPHATARVTGGVLYYTFPLLEQFSDRLLHGFSTRVGGVSAGGLGALNLGLSRGDAMDLVRENWRRFGAAVGFDPRRAVLTQQTHTVNLRQVAAADAGRGGPWDGRRAASKADLSWADIDGLLTAEHGLPLVSQYADCTPLLLYAADKNICATAHSGWRGTAAGMGARAVQALLACGSAARHIYCVIGPAAGPCCYEVDAVTAAHFARLGDEQGPVAAPRPQLPDKYLLDLWQANRCVLLEAGLPPQNIEIAGLCTICHSDVFYSHRCQGEHRGALAAVVMLR